MKQMLFNRGCDDCPGQNKNITIILLLITLSNKPNANIHI